MQQRRVGRTGLRVSRLGLGTGSWGKDTNEYEARDQLAAFVEAGGTLVDTAPGYGDGRSEHILGGLLDDVADREDLIIATSSGCAVGPGGGHRHDTSRGALVRQLETSLRVLGTDYVDLWQVHVWSDEAPWAETLSALDYAVRSGRARYAGVANYTGWQTAMAQAWQTAWPDRTPLASTQVEYSLLNRDAEVDVLPAAHTLGVGVFAWAPLGRGVLSGKYRVGIPADSRAASPQLEPTVSPYLAESSRRVVEAVARAADGLSLTAVEVALAWVRDRSGVTAPILGARTATQLRASLQVENVTLPDEIAAALADVSA